MIRIYFDWSVYSNFKKNDFLEIREFISKHKDYLQFPFTPAHFNDLMKSNLNENEYFQQDLQTLEYLSENHLLRWGKNEMEVLLGTPYDYFENENLKEDISSDFDIRHLSYINA